MGVKVLSPEFSVGLGTSQSSDSFTKNVLPAVLFETPGPAHSGVARALRTVSFGGTGIRCPAVHTLFLSFFFAVHLFVRRESGLGPNTKVARIEPTIESRLLPKPEVACRRRSRPKHFRPKQGRICASTLVFQRRFPEIGEELGAETNWIWSVSKRSSIWQWRQHKGRPEVAGRWLRVRRGGWLPVGLRGRRPLWSWGSCGL